jgi:ribose 5-phosphate isomerase B
LCRSGQGVCVVANKVRHVRAGLAWTPEVAEAGRRDDHLNVLCLPSDYIDQALAKQILEKFLETEPGVSPRYQRRLNKIRFLEEKI